MSIALLLLFIIGGGCEKNNISQKLLDGKWILLGFGNDSTNSYIPEPSTEPNSSYIIFDNGKMDAFSVSNRTFDMKYELKRGMKISITPGIITLVGGDTEWGQKFLYTIKNVYKYDIDNSELSLYYENQKYMRFKKNNQ